MATSNQEKTYNEFVKFYDLADNLIEIVENSEKEYAKEQFDEVEKTVLYLEDAIDDLTQSYIEIVKEPKNQGKAQGIKARLIEIQEKTKECRESLLKIYGQNN